MLFLQKWTKSVLIDTEKQCENLEAIYSKSTGLFLVKLSRTG
ncbi:hypothetical protein T4C_13805 [Trichinella pseudospiralis]|uniref:Uncharacterized protein n=1 Tax=Trichinella pseudospiralis TaxID=6337 RepID=A0A0V1H6J7_TRIPS|nr:hypothetical protein T4C_13805 [Trichinella pseudospiralis]